MRVQAELPEVNDLKEPSYLKETTASVLSVSEELNVGWSLYSHNLFFKAL